MVYLEAFHGGRIAASVVTLDLTTVAIEAVLDRNRVHTTTEAADGLYVDAGTTMAGVAHTFDPRQLRTPHLGERRTDRRPGRQRRLQRGTATGGAHRRRDAGRDHRVAGHDATAGWMPSPDIGDE
jgi:hypothetical protein